MYGENPFPVYYNEPFLLPCQCLVLIFDKFFVKYYNFYAYSRAIMVNWALKIHWR